jgi:hypothetical protein
MVMPLSVRDVMIALSCKYPGQARARIRILQAAIAHGEPIGPYLRKWRVHRLNLLLAAK